MAAGGMGIEFWVDVLNSLIGNVKFLVKFKAGECELAPLTW
jgi:hypothetical protein|tara:strand:+ start:308 stop:430 length:123 start_codon:yes stop_codon:yes gene_type:complete